ncbi:MAG: hypothetical protein AB7F96_04060 [Beijerinckiaceae bacterium]
MAKRLAYFSAGLAFFAAAAIGSAAPASASMTFRLEATGDVAKCHNRCPRVIVANGEIGRSTPDDFVRFIRRHIRDKRMRPIVFVHSPGGLVTASMRLGLLFRKIGAAVVVAQIRQPAGGRGDTIFTSAKCFSACVYALMGAKKRVVPPQSSVVVHRMFTYELLGDVESGATHLQKTYRNDKLYGDLTRYARMMGVSSSVIHAAESTPPGQVRVISQKEIRKWRLGVSKF